MVLKIHMAQNRIFATQRTKSVTIIGFQSDLEQANTDHVPLDYPATLYAETTNDVNSFASNEPVESRLKLGTLDSRSDS